MTRHPPVIAATEAPQNPGLRDAGSDSAHVINSHNLSLLFLWGVVILRDQRLANRRAAFRRSSLPVPLRRPARLWSRMDDLRHVPLAARRLVQ